MKNPAKQRGVRLLIACLLMLLLPCAAVSETLMCIVPEGQYVNVRKQPSASAATWGILHTGDPIETDPAQIESGFFKTTFKERAAYVSVRYFEIEVDAPHTVTANGRVRVRNAPAGEAIGFVKPGESVYVHAWRYASNGSRWGRLSSGRFVDAQYLSAQ